MQDVAGNEGQLLAQSHTTFQAWRAQWIVPVTLAVYDHRFDEARAMLAAAQAELASAELPEDVREALAYLIILTDCRVEWHPDSRGYTKQDYEAVLASLDTPAKSFLADCMRRSYLVFIRSNGTSDSHDELTRAELEELLAPLPEHLSTPAWQQLARWAYEHNDMEILERAYEVFLELPGNTMAQAKWQRVSLMHGLLSGSATAADVRSYLALLHLRPQLREFRNEFWPKCLELGLVDAGLETMLVQRETAVNGN
ncbi:hypothetical protein KDL29_11435 [bacterium]|nr:hypothetical protein [bacterium]UNM10011.1 MAG: hypothetical protein H7A35_08075 [Planctomycetales bacterium]